MFSRLFSIGSLLDLKALPSNQFRMINNNAFVRDELADDSTQKTDSNESEKRRERIKEKYGQAITAQQDFIFDLVDDASKELNQKIDAKTTTVMGKIDGKVNEAITKSTGEIIQKNETLNNKIDEIGNFLKRTKNSVFSFCALCGIGVLGILWKLRQQEVKLKEQGERLDSIKTRRVKSYFSDSSDTDYDREIEVSKAKINKLTDPCSAADEMLSLIQRLNEIKERYIPRPCMEGYCLGIFTPHRSRINRRIDSIEKEKIVNEVNCELWKDFCR